MVRWWTEVYIQVPASKDEELASYENDIAISMRDPLVGWFSNGTEVNWTLEGGRSKERGGSNLPPMKYERRLLDEGRDGKR